MAIHAQVWPGKKHPVVAGFQVRAQQFLPIVNGHRELRCLNCGNICSQGVCTSLFVCATPPRHVYVGGEAMLFGLIMATRFRSTQLRQGIASYLPLSPFPTPSPLPSVTSLVFFSVECTRGGRSPQKSIAVVYFRMYKYFTFMCSDKKIHKTLEKCRAKEAQIRHKGNIYKYMHACIFICYINSLILLQNKSYKTQ